MRKRKRKRRREKKTNINKNETKVKKTIMNYCFMNSKCKCNVETRTYLAFTCMLLAEKRLLNAFSVLTVTSRQCEWCLSSLSYAVSATMVTVLVRHIVIWLATGVTARHSGLNQCWRYPVPRRSERCASHSAAAVAQTSRMQRAPGCECVNQISRVKPSSSTQMEHAEPD